MRDWINSGLTPDIAYQAGEPVRMQIPSLNENHVGKIAPPLNKEITMYPNDGTWRLESGEILTLSISGQPFYRPQSSSVPKLFPLGYSQDLIKHRGLMAENI